MRRRPTRAKPCRSAQQKYSRALDAAIQQQQTKNPWCLPVPCIMQYRNPVHENASIWPWRTSNGLVKVGGIWIWNGVRVPRRTYWGDCCVAAPLSLVSPLSPFFPFFLIKKIRYSFNKKIAVNVNCRRRENSVKVMSARAPIGANYSSGFYPDKNVIWQTDRRRRAKSLVSGTVSDFLSPRPEHQVIVDLLSNIFIRIKRGKVIRTASNEYFTQQSTKTKIEQNSLSLGTENWATSDGRYHHFHGNSSMRSW